MKSKKLLVTTVCVSAVTYVAYRLYTRQQINRILEDDPSLPVGDYNMHDDVVMRRQILIDTLDFGAGELLEAAKRVMHKREAANV